MGFFHNSNVTAGAFLLFSGICSADCVIGDFEQLPRQDADRVDYKAHVDCVLESNDNYTTAGEEARLMVRLKVADELGAILYKQDKTVGQSKEVSTVMLASSASRVEVIKEERIKAGEERKLSLDLIVKVSEKETSALLDRLASIPELEHKVKTFETMVGSIRNFEGSWQDAVIPSEWWVGNGVVSLSDLNDVAANVSEKGISANNYIRMSLGNFISDNIVFGEPVIKSYKGEFKYILPARWAVNYQSNDGSFMKTERHGREIHIVPRWEKLMGGRQYSDLVTGKKMLMDIGFAGVALKVCIDDECKYSQIVETCAVFDISLGKTTCHWSDNVILSDIRYIINLGYAEEAGLPDGYNGFLKFENVRDSGGGKEHLLNYSLVY
jgi:hypothetical protein